MLRGVKQLPQGHTASKQQSQDSIPGVCDLKSPTLSAPRMSLGPCAPHSPWPQPYPSRAGASVRKRHSSKALSTLSYIRTSQLLSMILTSFPGHCLNL